MPRSYLVRGGSQPVFLYSPFPARALANEPLLRGHFIPRLSFRLFLPSPFSPISTKLRALRRACTTLGTLAFHERNNVYMHPLLSVRFKERKKREKEMKGKVGWKL